MRLLDTYRSLDPKEKGYWGLIGLSGGICAITMVFVPLLTILVGGWLTTTAQYGVATGLTVASFGVLYYGYHWWSRNRRIERNAD